MSICPVCSAQMHDAFTATLLKKYPVKFLHCRACGLLQTEAPYWLDEAYDEAIAVADTGLVMRNTLTAAKLATLLFCARDPRARYLDVAGGYGLLTRLMRDYGFDYYWADKYSRNLLARGFETHEDDEPYAAISAFEVLEHVTDPVGFIRQQLSEHSSKTFIFTTELYAGSAPPSVDWWYYAFNTGQHVSFYQRRTLEKIATRLGLKFYSFNGIHVMTDALVLRKYLLRIVTGRLAPIAAALVRRKLGSRIEQDHLKMIG